MAAQHASAKLNNPRLSRWGGSAPDDAATCESCRSPRVARTPNRGLRAVACHYDAKSLSEMGSNGPANRAMRAADVVLRCAACTEHRVLAGDDKLACCQPPTPDAPR